MKKAIILGASSGIGKATALEFIKHDYQVFITGRRESNLKEIQAIDPKKIAYHAFDLLREDCLEILEEQLHQFYPVDIIMISAGTGELNPELEFIKEKPSIKLNILTFTKLSLWAFHLFEKQGFGQLVVISSIGGLAGNPVAPAYSASKAYQINYLKGLRMKVKKSNSRIFITEIRPGFVKTAMAQGEKMFWVSSPQKAAKQIFRAIRKKKKTVCITKRWEIISLFLRIFY